MKLRVFKLHFLMILLLLFASVRLWGQVTSFYPGSGFLEKAGVLECREGINFMSSLFIFGGEQDSLRLVVATQVENQALQFVKDDDLMKSAMEFSLYLRNEEQEFVLSRIWQESLTVRRESEVRARVKSVFQTIQNVPAGSIVFSNEITDQNSKRTGFIGPNAALLPPTGKGFSSYGPYPLYVSPAEGEGELFRFKPFSRLDELLLNPGKSYGYGLEGVGFYIEMNRPLMGPVEPLSVRSSLRFEERERKDLDEIVLAVPGTTSLSVFMKPGMLGLGEGVFRVDMLDQQGSVVSSDSTLFFITLTEEWMLTEYEGAIKFLKYILTPKERKRFERAPEHGRRELWKAFWKERDPIPSTPQNERLVNYFRMVQVANARYSSPIMEGWKSDRGRVLIMLGPPDEEYLREEGRNLERYEIWIYTHSLGFQLTLYFLDKGYTGLYWLANEGDLQQALSRLRSD